MRLIPLFLILFCFFAKAQQNYNIPLTLTNNLPVTVGIHEITYITPAVGKSIIYRGSAAVNIEVKESLDSIVTLSKCLLFKVRDTNPYQFTVVNKNKIERIERTSTSKALIKLYPDYPKNITTEETFDSVRTLIRSCELYPTFEYLDSVINALPPPLDTSGYNQSFTHSNDTLYIRDGDGTLSVFLGTTPKARSAISLTTTGNSGAATYNSSTGVFNIPNYTLAGLGGVGGTGAANRWAYWSDANNITSSTELTRDGTRLVFGVPTRLANVSSLSLPASPLAGDALWETTNHNFRVYNGNTATWESFLKSANANGLGTANQVFYADANGRATSSSNLTFNGNQLVLTSNDYSGLLLRRTSPNTMNWFRVYGTGDAQPIYIEVGNNTWLTYYRNSQLSVFGYNFGLGDNGGATASGTIFALSVTNSMPFAVVDLTSAGTGTGGGIDFWGRNGNAATGNTGGISSTAGGRIRILRAPSVDQRAFHMAFYNSTPPYSGDFNNLGEKMRLDARGGLLINTTNYEASAILNVESTARGILPPRWTEAQRTAISSPATGLIGYQTNNTEGLYVKAASQWRRLLWDGDASLYTGWNLRLNGDVATSVGSGNTVQLIEGWGVDVTRSSLDVTIRLDTAQVATQYDLTQISTVDSVFNIATLADTTTLTQAKEGNHIIVADECNAVYIKDAQAGWKFLEQEAPTFTISDTITFTPVPIYLDWYFGEFNGITWNSGDTLQLISFKYNGNQLIASPYTYVGNGTPCDDGTAFLAEVKASFEALGKTWDDYYTDADINCSTSVFNVGFGTGVGFATTDTIEFVFQKNSVRDTITEGLDGADWGWIYESGTSQKTIQIVIDSPYDTIYTTDFSSFTETITGDTVRISGGLATSSYGAVYVESCGQTKKYTVVINANSTYSIYEYNDTETYQLDSLLRSHNYVAYVAKPINKTNAQALADARLGDITRPYPTPWHARDAIIALEGDSLKNDWLIVVTEGTYTGSSDYVSGGSYLNLPVYTGHGNLSYYFYPGATIRVNNGFLLLFNPPDLVDYKPTRTQNLRIYGRGDFISTAGWVTYLDDIRSKLYFEGRKLQTNASGAQLFFDVRHKEVVLNFDTIQMRFSSFIAKPVARNVSDNPYTYIKAKHITASTWQNLWDTENSTTPCGNYDIEFNTFTGISTAGASNLIIIRQETENFNIKLKGHKFDIPSGASGTQPFILMLNSNPYFRNSQIDIEVDTFRTEQTFNIARGTYTNYTGIKRIIKNTFWDFNWINYSGADATAVFTLGDSVTMNVDNSYFRTNGSIPIFNITSAAADLNLRNVTFNTAGSTSVASTVSKTLEVQNVFDNSLTPTLDLDINYLRKYEYGYSASSGEANTASNLGAGTGVFASKSGVDLRFKSLVAGSNVTLSNDANTITIAAKNGLISELPLTNQLIGANNNILAITDASQIALRTRQTGGYTGGLGVFNDGQARVFQYDSTNVNNWYGFWAQSSVTEIRPKIGTPLRIKPQNQVGGTSPQVGWVLTAQDTSGRAEWAANTELNGLFSASNSGASLPANMSAEVANGSSFYFAYSDATPAVTVDDNGSVTFSSKNSNQSVGVSNTSLLLSIGDDAASATFGENRTSGNQKGLEYNNIPEDPTAKTMRPMGYNVDTETNTTVTAKKFYLLPVDVSAGLVSINPPSSPAAGDWFIVVDSRNNAGTNNITVNTSSQKYYAASVNTTLNTNGVFIKFIYVNSTIGWIKEN